MRLGPRASNRHAVLAAAVADLLVLGRLGAPGDALAQGADSVLVFRWTPTAEICAFQLVVTVADARERFVGTQQETDRFSGLWW